LFDRFQGFLVLGVQFGILEFDHSGNIMHWLP